MENPQEIAYLVKEYENYQDEAYYEPSEYVFTDRSKLVNWLHAKIDYELSMLGKHDCSYNQDVRAWAVGAKKEASEKLRFDFLHSWGDYRIETEEISYIN